MSPEFRETAKKSKAFFRYFVCSSSVIIFWVRGEAKGLSDAQRPLLGMARGFIPLYLPRVYWIFFYYFYFPVWTLLFPYFLFPINTNLKY